MHEYNSLTKIRKAIYFSIPFILIILIIEFIYFKNLKNELYNINISYFQFREFYSLYFQLFTSILGITCIKNETDVCQNLVSIYSKKYYNGEEEENDDEDNDGGDDDNDDYNWDDDDYNWDDDDYDGNDDGGYDWDDYNDNEDDWNYDEDDNDGDDDNDDYNWDDDNDDDYDDDYDDYNDDEDDDEDDPYDDPNYFDFTSLIRGQTEIFASKIMDKRNNLVNIHKNIGNKKYKELFSHNVDYLRISQSYIEGKLNFRIISMTIEFTEAILILCNSFQIMSNTTSDDPIIFLNKVYDAFSLLNKIQNYGNELSQIQKEIYEMIINYKMYRENFNNINDKIFDIMYLKSKLFELISYLVVIIDTLFMLFISSLLYAYLLYFENILMKIINYVNMTINIKNDKFNFSEMFSKKIENLETILSIYNGDPIKAVEELNNLYKKFLTEQNKNNPNDSNKKGLRKISNIDNKKNESEMGNIPKNQRIV